MYNEAGETVSQASIWRFNPNVNVFVNLQTSGNRLNQSNYNILEHTDLEITSRNCIGVSYKCVKDIYLENKTSSNIN